MYTSDSAAAWNQKLRLYWHGDKECAQTALINKMLLKHIAQATCRKAHARSMHVCNEAEWRCEPNIALEKYT